MTVSWKLQARSWALISFMPAHLQGRVVRIKPKSPDATALPSRVVAQRCCQEVASVHKKGELETYPQRNCLYLKENVEKIKPKVTLKDNSSF